MKQSVIGMVCALLVWTAAAPGERSVVHARDAGEQAPGVRAGSARIRILDLDLVNQGGESVNFKRDIVGDKLIVMNFIYTTCTTACPILSLIFTRLQSLLGVQLGTEVALVSISVDPKTDTPARLKEFSEKHQARPGWSFLTGDASSITKVLSGLGISVSRIDDHPVMILVGDGRLGVWTRHYGFPSPEQIAATLDELRLARQRSGVAAPGPESMRR